MTLARQGGNVFGLEPEVLRQSRAYHPLPDDFEQVIEENTVLRCLVIGRAIPDVAEAVEQLRYQTTSDPAFPVGIYSFPATQGIDLMIVRDGESAQMTTLEGESESANSDLLNAQGWFESLFKQAEEMPNPRFKRGDEIIFRSSGQDSFVQDRSFSSGSWLYVVRLSGKRQTLREDELDFFPEDDDPQTWISQSPAPVEDFAATLTRAKLEGTFTDTVFSFRATKTIFRPYQFKPVIKLLQTGKSRILIADEVGLGKTIEAGLIWTELEARGGADRVLVVAPSSLVPKWRREMEERFDFQLEELSGKALQDFEERVVTGRLPKRGAYIGSLERLRRWDELQELTGLLQFDLAIFDEAHYLRNTTTRSNAFGSLVSELSENMVFLSATPLNLHNTDLFNLLDLLTPGEFGDVQALDERLQPNVILHKVQASLSADEISPEDRLAMLDELEELRFGRPLLRRPELGLLRDVLQDDLTPKSTMLARRYLSDLNALSAVISRTRKVEVDEKKAIREAITQEVQWTQSEREFYQEYYAWCKARADSAGTPIGFSMQMPLRLASACLPAARDTVLSWTTSSIQDEDSGERTETSSKKLPPHEELVQAAHAIGSTDSKLECLRPVLAGLVRQQKQALLFTFSRPTLKYLKEQLSPLARIAVLHGGVAKNQRHLIMSEFRKGNYDLVLANRVASEGLDFEFCSLVVNYDLPWNPMEIEQRIGRIDRIGQPEEKIQILNFVNEETIDERIMIKVLQRIGMFEKSIGALEPIIEDQFPGIHKTILDFSLSREQRDVKTDQVLEAIEAQTAGLDDLSSASSFLFTANDVNVSGMEDDLLRSGKYIGQSELKDLIAAWCKVADAGPVKSVLDGKAITFRGNARMSDHLLNLVQKGKRSTHEVRDLIRQLNDELEITLAVDQEYARVSGVGLLTANHPLALAATSLPDFQQERFGSVQVKTSPDIAPIGTYLLQLAVAEWSGIRPGIEIWGAAVDEYGRETSKEVTNAVLAAHAAGDLKRRTKTGVGNDPHALVSATTHALHARQVQESHQRILEAQALVESRIESAKSQHERKIAALRGRVETTASRGKTRAVRLFEAQIENANQRQRVFLEQLEQSQHRGITVSPLALCEVEIHHE